MSMELAHNSSQQQANSAAHEIFHISENTLTLIIGFGILILFVILGILASAFLCFTLKKDSYLWEADKQEQNEPEGETSCKERDKFAEIEEGFEQENTQI